MPVKMIPVNSLESKACRGFTLPAISKVKINSLYLFTDILKLVIFTIILIVFSSCSSSRSPKSVDKDGYHLIFDGKSLAGWEYDPVYWRVENGALVGEVTSSTLLKRNSFIIKKDLITRDFDLKVEYRVSSYGNSGINYRSESIDSLRYAMRGYQADIDGQNYYTGQNYEERGRTTLAYRGQKVMLNTPEGSTPLKDNIKNNAWTKTAVTGSLGSADSLKGAIRNEDWNEYHLIVRRNRLLHYINGVLMSDVTDNDTANRKSSGRLGVQVHVGPPMKIEYRNFRIKEIL
ncbi:MAG: DUF1080 domain-containing protein [Ginsengibacter sp.]